MMMMDRFLNIRKRHWVYKTTEIIVYEDFKLVAGARFELATFGL